MPSEPFGFSRIGQIAIAVRDVASAAAFYRDKLGMMFLFDAPNMAFFDCARVRLMLSVPEKPEFDHPASIVYYKVDNIESAFQTLRSRGVTVEREPVFVAPMPDHDLWMGFIRDCENNPIGVMSEVPRE